MSASEVDYPEAQQPKQVSAWLIKMLPGERLLQGRVERPLLPPGQLLWAGGHSRKQLTLAPLTQTP